MAKSSLKSATEVFLKDTAEAVEKELETVLPRSSELDSRLFDAMRYAVLGGGKRLRASLLRSCANIAGADDRNAVFAAAIVELVHGYSLVHDDLPAMDDDMLRRGKPTCHIAFDDATAILAGDALLTLAFELSTDPRLGKDPGIRCEFTSRLAAAAGGEGMVGGQMVDLRSENRPMSDLELVMLISRKKTAALIAFSCEAGAILAGRAGQGKRHSFREFGYDIGLGFQIVDDLLDVCGDEMKLGKAVGMDAKRGKATFVTSLGIEGARREADVLFTRALARLDGMGKRAETLMGITRVLRERQS